MSAPQELVYAVQRDVLLAGACWRGVRVHDTAEVMARLELGAFYPRPDAEADTSIKQIIPYLVLRDAGRSSDVTLEIANGVWVDTSTTLVPEFTTLAKAYGAAPSRLALSSANAFATINRWASTATLALPMIAFHNYF